MTYSPSQIEYLRRRSDECAAKMANDWPWTSPGPTVYGLTMVHRGADGWNVAARVVPGEEGAPAIQELRVFHEDNFSRNREERASMDRAFWLEEDEDTLDELSTVAAPSAPMGGITTTILKRVPFGEIFRSLKSAYGDYQAAFEDSHDWWAGLHDDEEPSRQRGRPDLGDRFYAAIADDYLALVRHGDLRPIETLAGQHQAGRETVATWLKQARKRGLLSSAGRGRIGGMLTAKAKELLEVEDDG